MLFIEMFLGNPLMLIVIIGFVFMFRKKIGSFFGRVTSGKVDDSASIPQLKPIRSDGGVAQWIYPSKLLDTPQSAFDFLEYPGLSVAMRLYIVVGKIAWWLAVLLTWEAYILTIILGLLIQNFHCEVYSSESFFLL